MLLASFVGGAFYQWVSGMAHPAWAAPADAAEVVRAKGFVLVDANGQERARLATTQDGASLVLIDSQARERLRMGVGPGQAVTVKTLDPTGRERAILGSDNGLQWGVKMPDAGGGGVTLGLDERGAALSMRLAGTPAGLELGTLAGKREAAMTLTGDTPQKVVAWLGLDADGAGIGVNGQGGKEALTLGTNSKGTGVEVNWPGGSRAVSLGVGADGAGVSLVDRKAQERLGLSIVPDGAAAMALKDDGGHELWRMDESEAKR
jgi:hypothetical protein